MGIYLFYRISNGQETAVTVAKTSVSEPEILILDEPNPRQMNTTYK